MLSKKAKYAINALVFLAKQPTKEPVLIESISTSEKIPKKFLETILLDLKRSGMLNSKKGKGGGYYLQKLPKEISLADVIRLFDGAIAYIPCASQKYFEACAECSEPDTCGIRDAFLEIRDKTVALLKKNTLEDLLKRERKLKLSKGD